MTFHTPEFVPDVQRLTRAAAREHVVLLRTNPDFAEVATETIRHFASGLVAGHQLNFLMSDRGRIFYLLGALFLHANPDQKGYGLTVSRLAALGRAHALGSRGRVMAFIGALRWTGFVVPETGPDRRAGALVPTEKFLSTMRERWTVHLCNLARLLPHGAAARDRMALDPDFVLAIGSHVFTIFASGHRALGYSPHLAALGDLKGALVILLDFHLARGTRFETPSIAALARERGVSRAHVRTVLRLAVEHELLETDADGEGLRVTPRLVEEVDSLMASVLAFFSLAAELALRGEPSHYFGNSIPISR